MLLVYGVGELKDKINVTLSKVECPVKGCFNYVERQRKVFRKDPQFMCPDHNIYISPSTFEYENYKNNLLWDESDDSELLEKQIMPCKRESRMGRDNSEDALTWNVFRYLEKTGLVSEFINSLLGTFIINPEIVYWSYSQREKGLLNILDSARKEFELVPSKGSEPDLIIKSENSLIFIEAKLTAGNNTIPSKARVEQKYISGGKKWWDETFISNFQTVAVQEKKCELSRFWLLGTWMARELGVDFHLVNLVLADREKDIEQGFGIHIKQNQQRKFRRMTWEDIIAFIANTTGSSPNKQKVLHYLNYKTIGYDARGRLQKAF